MEAAFWLPPEEGGAQVRGRSLLPVPVSTQEGHRHRQALGLMLLDREPRAEGTLFLRTV